MCPGGGARGTTDTEQGSYGLSVLVPLGPYVPGGVVPKSTVTSGEGWPDRDPCHVYLVSDVKT